MGRLHRLIAAPAAALLPAAGFADCDADAVELRGEWGTVRFTVETALTPEDQARGLMFRESLPRMAGMLFVYDEERELGFWMRNTLIPLDMIFADATGRVVRVHENAEPLDETVIRSGEPALAVLEINGGMAADLGIGPGDELRSPVMPQDEAAWPCDDEVAAGEAVEAE
jgi:uncharacterized membrane protein (UPF0127 family)